MAVVLESSHSAGCTDFVVAAAFGDSQTAGHMGFGMAVGFGAPDTMYSGSIRLDSLLLLSSTFEGFVDTSLTSSPILRLLCSNFFDCGFRKHSWESPSRRCRAVSPKFLLVILFNARQGLIISRRLPTLHLGLH